MDKYFFCKVIQILSDLFFYLISFPIAIYILVYFDVDIYTYLPKDQIDKRIILYLLLSIMCIGIFWTKLRHYTYRKPFWFELKEILQTIIIFSIIDLAFIAFSKLYFSRYLWLLNWSIIFILLPLGRFCIKNILIKFGIYLKDTIIIGSGRNALDAYNALASEHYLGFKTKYFVNDDNRDKFINNIPIIRPDELEKNLSKSTQFIIALEDFENEIRDKWLRLLAQKQYRSVSVIPSLRGLPLYSTDMSFIFSYDVILLRVNNNLAKRSSKILKRIMDILLSSLLIILLLPLFLILFFMISLDGGKPIYSHNRVGRNGKIFKCLKFRTMVVNSSEILNLLLSNDIKSQLEWKKDFKLKNDPRITRIGYFLRKYSLDELPQLWNVLKGDMSLVGPRPIVQEELERYQNDVDYYLMAKPGMTGLWQVSGRNNVDYEMRVYFDAWYVKNWSLWNDIAILFKTVNVVLKRDGAY